MFSDPASIILGSRGKRRKSFLHTDFSSSQHQVEEKHCDSDVSSLTLQVRQTCEVMVLKKKDNTAASRGDWIMGSATDQVRLSLPLQLCGLQLVAQTPASIFSTIKTSTIRIIHPINGCGEETRSHTRVPGKMLFYGYYDYHGP